MARLGESAFLKVFVSRHSLFSAIISDNGMNTEGEERVHDVPLLEVFTSIDSKAPNAVDQEERDKVGKTRASSNHVPTTP